MDGSELIQSFGPAASRPGPAITPGAMDQVAQPVGSVRLVLALLVVAVSVGLSNFAASIGLGAGGANARTRLHVAVIFGLFEGGMPALGLLLGRSLAGTLGDAAHWAGAGLLIATGGYALIQAARAARAAQAARSPGTRPDQPIPPAPESEPVPEAARAPKAPPAPDGPPAPEGPPAPDGAPAPAAAVPVPPGPAGQSPARLLVTGLALSMDNLVVGFAVGTFPVSLVTAVIVIAAVSVGLSLAGLELGSRLGARLGARTGSRGEVLGGLALIGVGIALAAGVP
jgi:manganese efflux pump family protein